jgi:hypothetical protein
MSAAFGLILIAISLLAGMVGYHTLVGLPWIDAFLSASMILSGMGPLASPATFAGKLFAGLYALYSGLALILVAGIILAPVAHRLFHHFPLEETGTLNGFLVPPSAARSSQHRGTEPTGVLPPRWRWKEG